MPRITSLARAKAIAGNGAKLASALGITPEAVYQWGDRTPVSRCPAIERLTGVTIYELRPDIFGRAPAGAPR